MKKVNLNDPFIVISNQLNREDTLVYNSILPKTKHEFRRTFQILIIGGLIIFIISVFFAYRFVPNSTQDLIISLMVYVLVISLFAILTVLRVYPYFNPYKQAWSEFLQIKEITGFHKDSLYLYIRSYIRKINPDVAPSLSSIYSDDELELLENPTTTNQKTMSKKVMNLLMFDWYHFADRNTIMTSSESNGKPISRKDVNVVWKIGYLTTIVMIVILGFEIYNAVITNASPLYFFAIGLASLQILIFFKLTQREIDRRTQRINPSLIRTFLENNKLLKPSDILFKKFQNYIDYNFPYIEL